ncbi:MAG: hypothetical protein WDN10_03775 [bacterium]
MELSLLTFQHISGAIAVILGAAGYVFYAQGIYQGSVKPHFFSWFVWGILTATAFAAQVVSGGGAGTWVTGFTALACLCFALVGLGASSRSLITKSDWIFFIAALLAIPVWYVTGDPLWSVILITVTDAVAFVPTFRKGYMHPETESAATYALSGIKFIFGILALQAFSVTTVLYPASLIVANGVFVLVLFWRKFPHK